MSLHVEWSERHVTRLRLGRLGCDACGLDVIDYVVQELAQNGKGRAGGVGVDLDVRVLCGGRVDAGFRVEGEDGLQECFWEVSGHDVAV